MGYAVKVIKGGSLNFNASIVYNVQGYAMTGSSSSPASTTSGGTSTITVDVQVRNGAVSNYSISGNSTAYSTAKSANGNNYRARVRATYDSCTITKV